MLDNQTPVLIEHLCHRELSIRYTCHSWRDGLHGALLGHRRSQSADSVEEIARSARVAEGGGKGGFVNQVPLWMAVREEDFVARNEEYIRPEQRRGRTLWVYTYGSRAPLQYMDRGERQGLED